MSWSEGARRGELAHERWGSVTAASWQRPPKPPQQMFPAVHKTPTTLTSTRELLRHPIVRYTVHMPKSL